MKRILIITILLQMSICIVANPRAVKGAGKDVTFEVVLDTAIKSPPLLILYNNTFYQNTVQYLDRLEIKPVSKNGNTYVFLLTAQNKPAYFTIGYKVGFDYKLPLEYYHFEPGDKVKINIKPGAFNGDFDIDFSGREVAKYTCQNEFLYAIRAEMKKMQADTADKDEDDNYRMTLRYLKACTAVIDKYRPQLSDFSYQLLKADITGKLGLNMVGYVHIMYVRNQINAKSDGDQQVADDYFTRIKPLNVEGIADSVLALSVKYGQYRLLTLMVERVLIKDTKSKKAVFNCIKEMKSGPLRDKLMVLHLIRNASKLGDSYNDVVNSSLSLTEDKHCLDKIKEFEHKGIGSKAFNFSLTDMHGKTVKMQDFKGKTVFIDYYFTGCTNCKLFYSGVRKSVEKKYESNKNMVFISISIDKDKAEWLENVKKGIYNDPKGINLYTNGEGASNDLIRYYNIMAYPTLMLMNKNGKIQNINNTELRNKESLVREIDEALAL